MDNSHPPLAVTAINFPDGRQARAVTAPADTLVEALAPGEPRAAALVFGSANSLRDDVRPKKPYHLVVSSSQVTRDALGPNPDNMTWATS